MSKIMDAAITTFKYDDLSFDELEHVAKRFDKLTEVELLKEFESIDSCLCVYNIKSVFINRITMTLYKAVAKRHNIEVPKSKKVEEANLREQKEKEEIERERKEGLKTFLEQFK